MRPMLVRGRVVWRFLPEKKDAMDHNRRPAGAFYVRPRCWPLSVALLALAVAGSQSCAGMDTGGDPGSGGSTAAGGSAGVGGKRATGGAIGSGGATGTGGVTGR